MFKVRDKYTNEILTVYHVRNEILTVYHASYVVDIMFLFYRNEKWYYDYARNYILVEEE